MSKTTIGPDNTQIGLITFGNTAEVKFDLAKYRNSTALLEAINGTQRRKYQGTNTADGLCKLMKEFTEGNGVRSTSATVYRVAIVLSDGLSNGQSTDCGWNTSAAAKAVRDIIPSVLVYTIGISKTHINERELMDIASDETHYTHIKDFHDLDTMEENIADDICWKGNR